MSFLKSLYARPISVLMGWAAVLLLGLVSWQKLPVELLPELEYPQITVVLKYGNASPEEIENLLVKPIEGAISGVQRLVKLESRCREDMGFLHAYFDWGYSMDFAALAIREKIDLIRDKLPKEADAPVVMKYSPFALPTAVLAVRGDLSADALREYVSHTLKSQLEKVDGVAQVLVRGGEEKEIRVEVAASKLQASGMSLLAVARQLQDANLNYPAGSLESKSSEYLLRTMGEFKSVAEIAELPIAAPADAREEKTAVMERPAFYAPRATLDDARESKAPSDTISEYSGMNLKDIALVVSTTKQRSSYSRHDGLENISVTIQKQSGATTTKVMRDLNRMLKKIRAQAPAGVTIETVYDQSRFIHAAFRSVWEAVLLGSLLTFGVLYYFLRNGKDAGVIFLSIPCCLLGSAMAMYFSGVSLNMISLGGLALAVGMLVDNSIVVIENIHRHRAAGEGALEAAASGTQEVMGAISSSTFAHIVVFLPMVFLTGIAGQIFRDLAYTVSFGLLFSLASAVTLTPVFLLILPGKAQKSSREIEFPPEMIQGLYGKLFANRRKVFRFCLAGFALGLLILALLPKELLPKVKPRQWTIQAAMPVGTSVSVTNEKLAFLEHYLSQHRAVRSVSVLIGSEKDTDATQAIAALRANEGELLVELRPWTRKRPRDVMDALQSWLAQNPIPGLALRYDAQQGLLAVGGMGSSSKTAVSLKGDDIGALAEAAHDVSEALEGVKGVSQVHGSMVLGSPEARLTVQRNLASAYQVSVRDIAATMKIAVEGSVPTTFKGGAYPVDMRVMLSPEDSKNFLALGEIRIPSSESGVAVPLKKVARLVQSSGPLEILRVDKQRTAVVEFAPKSRWAKARALRALKKLALPAGVGMSLQDEGSRFAPAFGELCFALALSLLLVFMILAAQFESLMQPFLILFTVPLSLLGVAVCLLLTGQSLNAISLLGMVVMGGIVVNNGILFVTVANQGLREGKTAMQTAVKAAQLRLRPILMTSATTVLGMLPMAIGLGEGAELNAPLAIVVIGGMLSSTPLVLGVLPCLLTTPWIAKGLGARIKA